MKLDLRDKQQLVEQLVECLIDQVKRYEKATFCVEMSRTSCSFFFCDKKNRMLACWGLKQNHLQQKDQHVGD